MTQDVTQVHDIQQQNPSPNLAEQVGANQIKIGTPSYFGNTGNKLTFRV